MKSQDFKLKLLSVLLSVVMILPCMTSIAWATTTDEKENESTPSVITDEAMSVVPEPTLPEALDMSTVPNIVGAEKAQAAGHVQRAYSDEQSRNVISFYNADGTRTEYIYNHPVTYVSADGSIRDITLDIQESSAVEGGFVSKDTWSQTAFSSTFTDGIMLSGGDVSLRLVPVFANIDDVITPITPITPTTPTTRASISNGNISTTVSPVAELKADGKSVVYTYDSKTRYEYSLTYSGFKEDIIVSEYTGQTEYTFKLYTNGLTLTEDDGDFYLCDSEGNVKGTLGSVIVFTADWQNNAFGTMTAETVVANNEYELTIHLDADYLRDEATLYPITIDPTIELNYSNNSSGIHDIVINTVDALSGTDGEISAGKWGSDQSISRILMKFPGLDLSSVPSAGAIVSATVYIHDLMCQHEELTLECYAYTGGTWYESNATWNNVGQPSSYSSGNLLDSHVISYYKGLEQTVSQEYGFDITDAVRGWKNGSYTQDKGIIFKAAASNENNTAHNYKTFASYQRANYKPYLKVTYNSGNVNENNPYFSFVDTLVSVPINETIYICDYITLEFYGTEDIYYYFEDPQKGWVDNSTDEAHFFSVGMCTITAVLTDANNTYTDSIDIHVRLIENQVYRIKNLQTQGCLDVSDKDIFGNVSVLHCSNNGNPNQLWHIKYVGQGQYSIHPMHNPNMFLAADSSGVYVTEPGDSNINVIGTNKGWTISDTDEGISYIQNSATGYSTNTNTLYANTESGNTQTALGADNGENNFDWLITVVEYTPRILVYDTSNDTLIHDTAVNGVLFDETFLIPLGTERRLSDYNRRVIYSAINTTENALAWSSIGGANWLNLYASSGTMEGNGLGSTLIKCYVNSGEYSCELRYNVTVFCHGLYYIRNRGQNTYLDKEDGIVPEGSEALLNSFSISGSQAWYVMYDSSGDYYSVYGYDDEANILNLRIENDSTSENTEAVFSEYDYGTPGVKFKIISTDNGAYKIIPFSGIENGYVLTARSPTETSHAPIEQRAYTADDDYRDEWFIIAPSNSVQKEVQEQSNWCWVAAARMSSMEYMISPISQASAAVYVKNGIESIAPSSLQMVEANKPANVSETGEALKYILATDKVYSVWGKIYNEQQLRNILDNDNPIIILKGWYSLAENNTYERKGGHYVVIYDYFYDEDKGLYLYKIYDSGYHDNRSEYSISYQFLCNSSNAGYSGELQYNFNNYIGIWEGIVVFKSGNYIQTIGWPDPN